ncbi:hypothetical protein HYC85_022031 [Camellia sinensis]|uniref:Uncharacterized protein n=1 Tax=Camellia sinensis TaxID=4442 RepID=A0A7J7GN52_CAMSI|nr:hypothetical protein HYC85_022031 [Camellia sinensis]
MGQLRRLTRETRHPKEALADETDGSPNHAQKYFLKVQKNGTIEHVPPPRPKHKAAHPYPQKAPKNGLSHDDDEILAPFQAFMAYPSSLNSLALGYSPWDDTSRLIHSPSGGIMLSQNEYNLHGVQGMHKGLFGLILGDEFGR